MSGPSHSLLSGASGIGFAYMEILIAMIIGLAHGNAPMRHYLVSPVIAAPVVLVAGLACAFINPVLGTIGSDAEVRWPSWSVSV